MGDTAVEIDATFEPPIGASGAGEPRLRDGIRRIQAEAEDAVGGGCTHFTLSDKAGSATRAPIPMILTAGAVHSHLVRQQLRTFTSLNVRAGECLDVHYFAVLIGVGATTVNAYLAQEAIAERHRRGLFEGGLSIEACVARYKQSINQGLLKVMSKMGISVISY